ncbi:ferredoxin III, nif-specific [Vibrio maritimus]|uniref:ferredoxin III, nif-specific n=1 Tax=Vibrio maritimus TaxID=990268 RepID=UPI003736F2A1
MTYIVGYTKAGSEWQPQFIEQLDPQSCIGCGRCYKVCSRGVFDLVENEVADDDDDDLYEDEVMMVMTIKDASDCIGCEACAKVCAKNCHSFKPAVMPAG